ncbi:hypothetical protein SAMN05216387_1184 [Nitrosovibrio tenuis]|uniref:Uncharacterized protein n=1 Tax=Nitrosovibrio tenuis TaxID=1233 RepID=A0A1H7RL40_9PROT|nr:hypothetical protein SAMN05216387_1184 [Nitrosovibrio tenuis]
MAVHAVAGGLIGVAVPMRIAYWIDERIVTVGRPRLNGSSGTRVLSGRGRSRSTLSFPKYYSAGGISGGIYQTVLVETRFYVSF